MNVVLLSSATTHAEITVHSYKNGLSDICKNGRSNLVRMDSYLETYGLLKNTLSMFCAYDAWKRTIA